MIAYNKTKLLNRRIVKKAKQWYAQLLLSTEQFTMAMERYRVDFYTPNTFVKIGLFLFTWISLFAATGLFSLFLMPLFEHASSGVFAFLCGLVATSCVLLLEMLIRQRKLYRSGIDEALLYAALFFVGCAIGILLDGWFHDTANTVLLFCIFSTPLLAAAAVRYADTLVSFILFACCYTVYFLLLLKLGDVAKVIMPFAFILLSALLYLGLKKIEHKEELQYWKPVMIVFECGSLLLFYLSGNYYVIREASVAFFGLSLGKGEDIPLAPFFYLFTAIVPCIYVFFGLKQKDRVLLWMGLLVVAASAVTFKYYFSTDHPEVLLVITGIILIGISYAAIKYLKMPRHGITFKEDPDENNFLQTNAEALLQARSFHQSQHVPAAHQTEFGGGSSGGGGATGDW